MTNRNELPASVFGCFHFSLFLCLSLSPFSFTYIFSLSVCLSVYPYLIVCISQSSFLIYSLSVRLCFTNCPSINASPPHTPPSPYLPQNTHSQTSDGDQSGRSAPTFSGVCGYLHRVPRRPLAYWDSYRVCRPRRRCGVWVRLPVGTGRETGKGGKMEVRKRTRKREGEDGKTGQ